MSLRPHGKWFIFTKENRERGIQAWTLFRSMYSAPPLKGPLDEWAFSMPLSVPTSPSGPLANYAPEYIADRMVASPGPGANLPAPRAVSTI